MAFISEDTRENFLNKCDGLLPLKDVEMVVCDALPSQMITRIENFQAHAKAEVGDKGRTSRPGGRRR